MDRLLNLTDYCPVSGKKPSCLNDQLRGQLPGASKSDAREAEVYLHSTVHGTFIYTVRSMGHLFTQYGPWDIWEMCH